MAGLHGRPGLRHRPGHVGQSQHQHRELQAQLRRVHPAVLQGAPADRRGEGLPQVQLHPAVPQVHAGVQGEALPDGYRLGHQECLTPRPQRGGRGAAHHLQARQGLAEAQGRALWQGQRGVWQVSFFGGGSCLCSGLCVCECVCVCFTRHWAAVTFVQTQSSIPSECKFIPLHCSKPGV